MYYVYVLQSLRNTNWIYLGYSTDLRKRLTRHFKGLVKSTKSKLPLRLVYYEAYLSKEDAAKREYELKIKGVQKSLLKKRINNSLNLR